MYDKYFKYNSNPHDYIKYIKKYMSFIFISIGIVLLFNLIIFVSCEINDGHQEIITEVSFNTFHNNTNSSLSIHDVERKYDFIGLSYINQSKYYPQFQTIHINPREKVEDSVEYKNSKNFSETSGIISKTYILSTNFQLNTELYSSIYQRTKEDPIKINDNLILNPSHYDIKTIFWFLSIEDSIGFKYKDNPELMSIRNGFGVGLAYKSIVNSFIIYFIPGSNENQGENEKVKSILEISSENSCLVQRQGDNRTDITISYFNGVISIHYVSNDSTHQSCMLYKRNPIYGKFKIAVTSQYGRGKEGKGLYFKDDCEVKKMIFINKDKYNGEGEERNNNQKCLIDLLTFNSNNSIVNEEGVSEVCLKIKDYKKYRLFVDKVLEKSVFKVFYKSIMNINKVILFEETLLDIIQYADMVIYSRNKQNSHEEHNKNNETKADIDNINKDLISTLNSLIVIYKIDLTHEKSYFSYFKLVISQVEKLISNGDFKKLNEKISLLQGNNVFNEKIGVFQKRYNEIRLYETIQKKIYIFSYFCVIALILIIIIFIGKGMKYLDKKQKTN